MYVNLDSLVNSKDMAFFDKMQIRILNCLL